MWADDVSEKLLAIEKTGEVYNDLLQKLKQKRIAFETILCGYKPAEPIGNDHVMYVSATVESAARDEGGERDEVVIRHSMGAQALASERESMATSEEQ